MEAQWRCDSEAEPVISVSFPRMLDGLNTHARGGQTTRCQHNLICSKAAVSLLSKLILHPSLNKTGQSVNLPTESFFLPFSSASVTMSRKGNLCQVVSCAALINSRQDSLVTFCILSFPLVFFYLYMSYMCHPIFWQGLAAAPFSFCGLCCR